MIVHLLCKLRHWMFLQICCWFRQDSQNDIVKHLSVAHTENWTILCGRKKLFLRRLKRRLYFVVSHSDQLSHTTYSYTSIAGVWGLNLFTQPTTVNTLWQSCSFARTYVRTLSRRTRLNFKSSFAGGHCTHSTRERNYILSPFEHRIRPILGPIRKSNIFSVFAVYVTYKFNTYFGIFCS